LRYENGHGISLDDRDGHLAGQLPGAVFAGVGVNRRFRTSWRHAEGSRAFRCVERWRKHGKGAE